MYMFEVSGIQPPPSRRSRRGSRWSLIGQVAEKHSYRAVLSPLPSVDANRPMHSSNLDWSW